MTKRIERKPQAEDLLNECRALVCSPVATDEMKIQCVTIAFNLGLSKGHVDGAQEMGEHLVGTLRNLASAAAEAARVPG